MTTVREFSKESGLYINRQNHSYFYISGTENKFQIIIFIIASKIESHRKSYKWLQDCHTEKSKTLLKDTKNIKINGDTLWAQTGRLKIVKTLFLSQQIS